MHVFWQMTKAHQLPKPLLSSAINSTSDCPVRRNLGRLPLPLGSLQNPATHSVTVSRLWGRTKSNTPLVIRATCMIHPCRLALNPAPAIMKYCDISDASEPRDACELWMLSDAFRDSLDPTVYSHHDRRRPRTSACWRFGVIPELVPEVWRASHLLQTTLSGGVWHPRT